MSETVVPFADSGYASTGFLIWGGALVFLMIPGLGFFYSGMSRSKNALSMIMITMLALAVVMVQWACIGFSLAFSESGSPFIGDCAHCGLKNVDARALPLTAPTVPSVVFSFYQMMFACITPAIIFGGPAERFRLLPATIFVLIWTTIVYDPVAYWTWSARGWLKNISCLETTALSSTPCGIGSLDFAGGGPVHVCSGFSALAFSIVLGRRRRGRNESFRPHNMTLVFLGTALLWFGWFGFNAGSAITATPRAGMAAMVTTLATAAGALSWTFWDMIFSGNMSGLGFCSGAVAALVAITPAAGYVAPWAALVIGALAGVICNLGCRLKGFLGFDDALDAWGVHGVGGMVGNVLTGFFAQKSIAALDGSVIPGGAMDGHWIQLGYQVAGTAAIAGYSFVVSYVVLRLIHLIPGLQLRPTDEYEQIGADIAEMGEIGYEIFTTPGQNDDGPKYSTPAPAPAVPQVSQFSYPNQQQLYPVNSPQSSSYYS
ncbi:ammonium transporter AmtB-like domain-containing protein [Cladochytrium replicatum]|nr:ammonium transporter AmtB-like domain-containing protein [Cladochytrium replicatum]